VAKFKYLYDTNQNCLYKKLRADEALGEFPTIRTRFCFLKANVLKNVVLLFCVFLCMSVKIGLSQ